MRGTFVIDEDFMLRHYHINNLPLGRNVDEVLRIIDSIDFHREYGDVCPAGWTKNQEAMPLQQKVWLITSLLTQRSYNFSRALK